MLSNYLLIFYLSYVFTLREVQCKTMFLTHQLLQQAWTMMCQSFSVCFILILYLIISVSHLHCWNVHCITRQLDDLHNYVHTTTSMILSHFFENENTKVWNSHCTFCNDHVTLCHKLIWFSLFSQRNINFFLLYKSLTTNIYMSWLHNIMTHVKIVHTNNVLDRLGLYMTN